MRPTHSFRSDVENQFESNLFRRSWRTPNHLNFQALLQKNKESHQTAPEPCTPSIRASRSEQTQQPATDGVSNRSKFKYDFTLRKATGKFLLVTKILEVKVSNTIPITDLAQDSEPFWTSYWVPTASALLRGSNLPNIKSRNSKNLLPWRGFVK